MHVPLDVVKKRRGNRDVEWIETTGVTVAEAKERALDRLGVPEDELEYEILVEASRSMLGLRRSEARLRSRVRPRQALHRPDRGDKVQRGKNRKRTRTKEGNSNSNSVDTKSQKANQTKTEQLSRQKKTPKPVRNKAKSVNNQKSGSNSRQTHVESSDEKRARVKPGTTAKAPKGEQMELETQAEIVQGFLGGLLDDMGLDARVVTNISDDRLSVEAQGLNLGLAIGQRGETVRAITEIARTIVQRQSNGDAAGSLTVDIGGYRERRRTFLADFARTQAEAVLDDGRTRVLEPMNSADRKVVHDTVAEIEGVDTESEGSDRDRRVVIRNLFD